MVPEPGYLVSEGFLLLGIGWLFKRFIPYSKQRRSYPPMEHEQEHEIELKLNAAELMIVLRSLKEIHTDRSPYSVTPTDVRELTHKLSRSYERTLQT